MQINNHLTYEHCPLCKSANIYQIAELNYHGKVKFCTADIELSRIPELWKCRQCLSCFVQHTIDEYTAKMLYSTGLAGERWNTDTFQQNKTLDIVKCMAEIFKNKDTVLDVGCNTGELLDFARSLDCKTFGVEFSSASQEILSRKGHYVYSAFEEASAKYDVITAFDLVEHLYDVPGFLHSCQEKLTEKGRLIILTGNIASLSAKLSGAKWWYAQYPEHIVFPSKKYFLHYSGFEIEKWLPTYASRGYQQSFFKSYLTWVKILLRGKPYAGLPSLGCDHTLMVLKK